MVQEIKDITIIGGGPTGLFALFYAGMRSVSAQTIDALPDAGGQLTALYPEKYIFDVAGIPQVLAKDFVRSLVEQAGRFQQPIHLLHRVTGLEQDGKEFVLVTDRDRFPTRSIIIAAGIGAFAPRRLPQRCAEQWYGRGIYDIVTDPEAFRDRRVLVIGGGGTDVGWGSQIREHGITITPAHRPHHF